MTRGPAQRKACAAHVVYRRQQRWCPARHHLRHSENRTPASSVKSGEMPPGGGEVAGFDRPTRFRGDMLGLEACDLCIEDGKLVRAVEETRAELPEDLENPGEHPQFVGRKAV